MSAGARRFTCQVCGKGFELSTSVLARYPGWTPRFCREHSARRPAAREENLTRAEVLAKYDAGPDTGVFTDGSAIPNPGPGGWGFVWVERGEVRAEGHGSEDPTTNNRMELQALIEAYRVLPEDAQLTLHTDSRLCVQTLTEWAPAWEKRGWTRKGGPIQNLERVQELLALHRAHPRCELVWIASHAGLRWNEYADSLSTAWMREEV